MATTKFNGKDKIYRLKKAILLWVGALIIGFIVAIILNSQGWYLPCPFRTLTGYLCPGCGTTRMFMALLQLDFVKAYHYNRVVFLSLPIIIICLIKLTINYVKFGNLEVPKWMDKILVVVIVALLAFGVIRNLI